LAALVVPFIIIPVAPLASVGLGIASSHLWLLNLRQAQQSLSAVTYPIAFLIAASGLGWLMAGMIMLSKFGV
jgi:hypothetical protein